jgi:hypothetical protein
MILHPTIPAAALSIAASRRAFADAMTSIARHGAVTA